MRTILSIDEADSSFPFFGGLVTWLVHLQVWQDSGCFGCFNVPQKYSSSDLKNSEQFMQFAFLQLKRKVSSEFSVPSIFQQTFKQTISMINLSPTSSNPLLPSFVAVWIEMFLHALCGTENKILKKKGGKSTKLETKKRRVFVFSVSRASIPACPMWTVGLSVTDLWPSGGTSSWLHMPWPLGNSKIADFKTDVGGFTDAFQVSFVSSLRFYFHVSAFSPLRSSERC